ncbi:hypothetical protein ABZX90_41510 [Streptomyces sp. NPDC002935]|uniref:hypothetical protein n=1 Tax=Streptomyces sp. NPDC002935 TaxID=3154545 RepID=UPI0033B64B83
MPHPATPRPLRQSLQPMIAGAVLASSHPGLTADSIEIDHLGVATGDDPLGLRVFLYYPGDGVFQQWVHAIGATEFGAPRPTSRPGELSHTATGHVGHTPVEVTCLMQRDEWVWRTSTESDVHKRDHAQDGSWALCGDLIVGVVDPGNSQQPQPPCPGCEKPDTVPAAAR